MRRALLLLTLVLPACNDVPWLRTAEPPPGADVVAFAPDASLADGLEMIGAVLDSAIAHGLDDTGVGYMLRAEMLTDRVLETNMPFGWLASDYSVEARVWQIQAQADRIVARVRAGAGDDLLPEAESLRADVAALREALSAGGEPAPAPVEGLLERLDAADRRTS